MKNKNLNKVTQICVSPDLQKEDYIKLFSNKMLSHLRLLTFVFLLPVLMSICTDVAPQEAAIADIVLIIDSSVSMDRHDPNDLRKTAVKFFIDLADPTIKIAIVGFNGSAQKYAELTSADAAGKRQLKSAVDRVDSDGDSGIAAAFELGFNLLSASISPNARKVAVLLTDGWDSEPKTASDYVQNYAAKGWDVYTIGLGNEVDRVLLADIAELTPAGEYFPASLENVQTIFNRIFASITRGTVIFNNIGFINSDQFSADEDVNKDGAVDEQDLAIVSSSIGQPEPNPAADVNNDGVVDIQDLSLVTIAINTSKEDDLVIPEDVNEDGVVNILDMVLVASEFGRKLEDLSVPAADVNGDGVVNILDLVAVASAFGSTASAPSW